MKPIFFSLFLAAFCFSALAQKGKSRNLVYVDSKGVLRNTANNGEAAFFGVNYTVPFAYGYRSHLALGIDPEKAIDADVYHLSRLGLDAFRVHVWDVEISDSLGNLLVNEHLRLFDYLLFKLKEKGIKILVTPIAFWGSGYPEPDLKTNGFSSVYGKGPAVVKEEAIRAQETYLKQFFKHVNPYTGLTYTADPDVIAAEINNEPHHSGPKEKTTGYVNRLATAVRSAGWTKPVFYNISESPAYADAVVKANVNGHSFQWYPTGLVANREQKGNLLPNVDRYDIPFADTIAAFQNRARMVYEFDAADVLQPIMYPAMARSFRTAGFQWATQFAYDPMATAYANTEYQTHYLNLAYTPAKAISLLIASRAFHRLPRGKSYGPYPADTLFDVFRLSYAEQLSEMNSEEEFYYSASTASRPKNGRALQHLAGVGSSPVVQYEGTGAYFLDRLPGGDWRLEVMPDAIRLQDPFAKASPRKTVTGIEWRDNGMQIHLPGLEEVWYLLKGGAGTNRKRIAGGETFSVAPGVYLLSHTDNALLPTGGTSFYAPQSSITSPTVVFTPLDEVAPGKSFSVCPVIAGVSDSDSVNLEIRHSANRWKTVAVKRGSGYTYKADVPAEMVTPGVLNYRLIIRRADGAVYTFPGGYKGDPYAWDEYRNESWKTFVAAANAELDLFNATTDRGNVNLYTPDWRANTVSYPTTPTPGQLALAATIAGETKDRKMGWQFYFGEKLDGRRSELSSFQKIVIRARGTGADSLHFSMLTTGAAAYGTAVALTTDWTNIEIPLNRLQPVPFLLLPRPYPGFQPLYFTGSSNAAFDLRQAEKLEVSFSPNALPSTIEVQRVWLDK